GRPDFAPEERGSAPGVAELPDRAVRLFRLAGQRRPQRIQRCFVRLWRGRPQRPDVGLRVGAAREHGPAVRAEGNPAPGAADADDVTRQVEHLAPGSDLPQAETAVDPGGAEPATVG